MAKTRKRTWLNDVVYDLVLWCFSVVVDLFFREVHPRASYRIPTHDPVIFVAAPHANQFVDPLILGGTVRNDSKRRISFLIAEKSMRRFFIGWAASLVGSVSVGRALDMKKLAKGKIYLPDPEGDPTLIKGIGTDFTDKQFMPSGLIVLPSVDNAAANTEIKEIIGPEELRVKKAFKGDVAYQQLTGRSPPSDGDEPTANGDVEKQSESRSEGTKFNVAPHIDQSAVYQKVFDRLKEGGCLGIFPEGGSHDRTELLPLKPGLAIMALGALAENPDCGVKIVPVGMNYFHPHKFRSRAVIEFGNPISPEPELVEQYKNGNRREAVQSVMNTVVAGLQTVTTLAPDYDTLMLIQAVRRLYNPKGKELPLSMVVELNRRLIKGYEAFKDDPRVIGLRRDVLDYNKQLFALNIRDHQVGYARYPWYETVRLILLRTFKLLVLSVAVIPGVVLFAPVFIAGKIISVKKSKEALAASTVKIRARDVIATWKILVTLALTPVLDITYTSLLTWWTYYNRVGGRVPEWIGLKWVAIVGLIFFPAICFMALRFGEVGMDIFKSLRPLLLSVTPGSSNSLHKLSQRRENLTIRLNNLINELGPELFPDFDKVRMVSGNESPDRSRPATPVTPSPTSAKKDGTGDIDALSFSQSTPPPPGLMRHPNFPVPRNESFKNIGSVGIFASRPGTPNRSRSRANSGSDYGHSPHHSRGPSGAFSSGFGSKLKGFTQLEPAPPGKKADLDEVSKNLHAAMRERGRRRVSDAEASESTESWVEFDRDDSMPPAEGEEGGKKDI